MTTEPQGPVVCFSYLAAASLWTVPRFPAANHGAEIQTIEPSIAADGPMVAAILQALDVPTLLLANGIAADLPGTQVRTWLDRYGVPTTIDEHAEHPTPQITIVADDHGTRTWFPHLPGVVEDLAELDLTPIVGASFVYLDCYELIEAPAVRAIQAARTAGVPLLLNLGGSPLSSAVAGAIEGTENLIVQTNVDDADHTSAADLAVALRQRTNAAWVVVTAGAFGAFAASQTEALSVPAFQIDVHHTHCAGAAFSGGLLYGLLHDLSMRESLRLGCVSGALRCRRAHSEPMPRLTEFQALVAQAATSSGVPGGS